MYTKFYNYYEWKNLEVINGRKFFTCDIADNFKFVYWIFVPKEVENHRGR